MSRDGEAESRRGRGFRHAARLLEGRIRRAGEARGFPTLRLLTHWDEVVGPDLARLTRPGKLSYGRGFGATLTLHTTGAAAPLVQMQAERIVTRVNACCGYAAISRVRVVQVAPETPPPAAARVPAPPSDPRILGRAAEASAGISDPDLRAALETLARNVLSRNTC